MIHIEILDCPDPDYICELIFHSNPLFIGKDPTCSLFLPDSRMPEKKLSLEIIDNVLIAQLDSTDEFFWVNDKRSKKIKFLQINDVIKLGSTLIKIRNFAKIELLTKRHLLNQNTDEIIKEKSPLLEMIKEIQKKL